MKKDITGGGDSSLDVYFESFNNLQELVESISNYLNLE